MSIESRIDKIENKMGIKKKWHFTIAVSSKADVEEALKQERKKIEEAGYEPGNAFIIIVQDE